MCVYLLCGVSVCVYLLSELFKSSTNSSQQQNRINCDPTHELEEMIVEPNPLHKKATRLSKRQVRTLHCHTSHKPHNTSMQPRCEDEKTQAALDKINKEFITYNRIKDRYGEGLAYPHVAHLSPFFFYHCTHDHTELCQTNGGKRATLSR